jgi:putative ABC transport system permease protein
MTARGYDSPRAVWNAIHANRGLAVVDPWIVPRKANYGGGGGPDFQLRGFYLEDRTLGFMGLGLVGGVAALGVISARAVVERRQQIGVLRAIGFRRRMIQLSFFFESSFIALTSIVVGTLLGLAVALNVIYGAADQSGMENLSFDVPWLTLAVIFLAVYAVALLTTLEPARRASRVFPAEALRYQ